MPRRRHRRACPTNRGHRTRRRLTALIVACALFMQNLDSTVIATALPTMAHAFGAEPAHMNVALTSYLLSLAVFIPASGWMADRFGARTRVPRRDRRLHARLGAVRLRRFAAPSWWSRASCRAPAGR